MQNTLRATLISSFFFFIVIFNINKLEGKELIFGKLSLIAGIISILAYKMSMLVRFGMFFDLFYIITLPLIFSKMKKGHRQILFIVMLGIYLLRYYSFFSNPMYADAYGTYETILNPWA